MPIPMGLKRIKGCVISQDVCYSFKYRCNVRVTKVWLRGKMVVLEIVDIRTEVQLAYIRFGRR